MHPLGHYGIFQRDYAYQVAEVLSRGCMPEMVEANARLIAAAPELLAVAKHAANLSTGQDCDPAHHVLVVEAMEALTKAIGPDWQNANCPSVGATEKDHE